MYINPQQIRKAVCRRRYMSVCAVTRLRAAWRRKRFRFPAGTKISVFSRGSRNFPVVPTVSYWMGKGNSSHRNKTTDLHLVSGWSASITAPSRLPSRHMPSECVEGQLHLCLYARLKMRFSIYDFRLPSQCKWCLCSSAFLRSVYWYLPTLRDYFSVPNSNFKQSMKTWDCLASENWRDRKSRNVGK
jgi:hypothetical protein